MTIFNNGNGRELWKGVAAGAIGGVVASWAMNQFQKEWNKAAQAVAARGQKDSQPTGQQRQSEADSEDATMRTAEAISEIVLHRHLSKQEKRKLGPVVHYSFGATMGAVYGAVSELTPKAAAGDGVLFGTALFAAADELGLWALKMAGPPTKYPLSVHAQALASHCVYGMTTETVRKALRHVW